MFKASGSLNYIATPALGGGLVRAKHLYKCGFATDRIPAVAGMAEKVGWKS